MSKAFGEELLFEKADAGALSPDEQRSLARRSRERKSKVAGWCEQNARLRSEIERLRLTDAEREAVEWAAIVLAADETYSSVLRGLARRLGGDR